MISFFRKVRRTLIGDGASQKYLLYALGEISLVVIGILIALQVNAWNEEHKLRKVEMSYLQALSEEYAFNLAELNRAIERNNSNLASGKELLIYTGPKAPALSDSMFSELCMGTLNAEVQFRPSSGVLQEILSSGKLDIFQSAELKAALAEWGGVLQKVNFQESSELGQIRNKLTDQIALNINVRHMIAAAVGESLGFDEGSFPMETDEILQSQQFESLLAMFVATSLYLNVGYYAPAKESIEEILDLVARELER